MGGFGKAWKGKVEKGRFFKEGTGSVTIPGKEYAKIIPKDNRRVKNARKVRNAEGIQFDSELEMFMDNLLAKSGMKYDRQYRIVLMDKFRDKWTGEAVREIGWVVDFWLPDIGMLVDTKGWATEVFELKYKLFQRMVYDGKLDGIKGVKFAKNQGQCILVLNELKALSRGTG